MLEDDEFDVEEFLASTSSSSSSSDYDIGFSFRISNFAKNDQEFVTS